MKLRGESGAVPARMGGARTSGGIIGPGGKSVNPAYTVRSTTVDTGTKRMVTKQNRAAESYRIKDLDKAEKAKAYRQKAKIENAQRIAANQNKAVKKAAGAATVSGIALGMLLESKTKLVAKPTSNKAKTTKPKAK